MSRSNPTYYALFEPLHPLSIGFKSAIITIVSVIIKSTPTQPTWAIIMVLFAALFLVPIAFVQLKRSQSLFPMNPYGLVYQLPCAVFLAFSFMMERGTLAGIFAIPYAVWCAENFIHGLKINTKWVYLATLITFGFLANASLWLVFDRFDVQPLGFSMWIVILTGVHFHFAGFALMACLTLFLCLNPNCQYVQMTIVMIVIGVILTATGIITTQLGNGQELETFAGVWMSLSGLLAGLFFIKKSFEETPLIKALWFVGGLCLSLAMVLACLYALRSITVLEDLTLPFMQAIHGTLNALGFGSLVLLGLALRKNKIQDPPQ